MEVGEIYKWVTDQAAGYIARPKYHIYIGEGDWRYQGHVFLFVNKSGVFESYRLTNPPYDCFSLAESFVSLTGVVSYGSNIVPSCIGPCLGRLSAEHLRGLRAAVAASQTLEGYAITFLCRVLDGCI